MSTTTTKYRGDLILFMIIAFAVSWGAWFTATALGGAAPDSPGFAPYVLGAFGPLIGAAVIRLRRAKRGEPAPDHTVRFRRSVLVRTPLLLVLGSATVLGGALLAQVAGDPAVSLDNAMSVVESNPAGPVAFFLTMLLTGPLSEEPGWRGTAFPRMRASLGRVRVSLVLGVIWAVWHLPLFFVTGTVQNQLGLATPSGVLFAASSIPMAMLCCCAYERAGVAASVAVHFAVNTTMVLVGVAAPVAQALILGIQAVVVAVLLATHRPATTTAAPTDGAADTRPDVEVASAVSR
ncbi:CPBP family intramembrane glutamic endopeptidase [Saccharomonospora azurea]